MPRRSAAGSFTSRSVIFADRASRSTCYISPERVKSGPALWRRGIRRARLKPNRRQPHDHGFARALNASFFKTRENDWKIRRADPFQRFTSGADPSIPSVSRIGGRADEEKESNRSFPSDDVSLIKFAATSAIPSRSRLLWS